MSSSSTSDFRVLNVDRNEAVKEINKRLTAAETLAQDFKKAADLNDLMLLNSDFVKWDDYTTIILKRIFSKESVIGGYTDVDIHFTFNTVSSFRYNIKKVILLKLTKLESLRDQVKGGLFKRAPLPKTKHSGKEVLVTIKKVSQVEKEKMNAKLSWKSIEDEFGVSKVGFGRKINFITDPFKRTIIFRDIEHAYSLTILGFPKPAVLLAGGVIEELLRQYLSYKNIKPAKDTFDEYIKTCESQKLLKTGVYRLSDSVRNFQNLVHLAAEKTSKHTMSKATAKTAVASIFTIANDF